MQIDATTAPARVSVTEEVVRRHQVGVWRYLRFLGCSPEQAEDLAQETFLALLRNPPEDRGRRALAAWLRRTALRRFQNAGRRPRPGIVLDGSLLERAWADVAPDDGHRYLDALDRCLSELPEIPRRAVDLRYREGRSRSEIAAALGLSLEGAKTALRRARARLSHCIEARTRNRS